ncbi:hypothetical protein H0H81_009184 [Sphagnurus paluster]|uniref:Uncharacterized protein n=1 Tax=Sphagnurus paluster TaxID=117069 RepID=A0A9P7K8K9_9AGAR|nr:hypothetical protein H0H81_009184 [Sphagnurus paluster]
MKALLRAYTLALLLHCLGHTTQASSSLLSDSSVRKGIHDVLDHPPAKHSECKNHKPTGPIETTMCDYETVESVNEELLSNLSELVRMPFFKYFQVDLYRECPFWNEYGSCNNPGCAITTVDESDVPEKWRSTTLSKLESSSIEKRHELPGCYYRDSDFCFLDDNTEGDYFDLSLVPERFTGYSGPNAHRIWRSIYEENCFGLSELNLMTGKSVAPVSLPDSMSEVFAVEGKEVDHAEQCLEKRVYYKVISASHPERLQYIYFNTVLLLRAVSRLGPYLSAYDYCSTGTHEDDQETLSRISKVVNIAQNVGRFDETVLFRGENANILKEEFKTHFRNVTRIMDCVGCDKCRLWGKVQTTGLATAMKILFELDEKALDPYSNANLLQRAEVVALINTLHRFVESLEAVNKFRTMWSEMSSEDSEDLITKTKHQSAAKEEVGQERGWAGTWTTGDTATVERNDPNLTFHADVELSLELSGPTLRVPEKAAARSYSPLPDYETSEASQKLITKELTSHKGVDPRLWRAIIYAFAIYVLLSIVIGVPIIIMKKEQQEDRAINFGPPSWNNEPDTGTAISISSSDSWALGDTAQCEWDHTGLPAPPYYIAKSLGNSDYVGVDVKVLLPNKGPAVPLDNFITCLPWFSQKFGDLKNHLTIKSVALEGVGHDIVSGVRISSLKSQNSSQISSTVGKGFQDLDSVKGDINTTITLEHPSTAVGPTSLAIDTGDGAINAQVTLVSPSSRPLSHSSPFMFIAEVATFGGPLNFQALYSPSTPPSPLQLTAENPDGNTNVILDKDYEGTYNIQSKLGPLSVQKPYLPPSMDPTGQNRIRSYQGEQQSPNQMLGWVGWGKRPSFGSGVFQGQVKITTSLSPIMLQLGSTTDS